MLVEYSVLDERDGAANQVELFDRTQDLEKDEVVVQNGQVRVLDLDVSDGRGRNESHVLAQARAVLLF